MPRLVTFGCSHTFGYGMPDNFPIAEETFKPSQYGWPVLLSAKLGYELCNNAFPGIGNTEIFDKILRFEFKEDDLCLIMWSHFVRLDFFSINTKYEIKKDSHTKFPPLDYTNAYKNYLVMQHAALYLADKNVTQYSFLANNNDEEKYPCPIYINIRNRLDIHSKQYFIDKALDHRHFGVKSHEKLADLLFDKLV